MARIRLLLTTLVLASAFQASACTPPTAFTPWPERVAQAYSQSHAVFLARAQRTQTIRHKDGSTTVRTFVKPFEFFKGSRAVAPTYIDKESHTCDQRPVPSAQGTVLVFALAKGDLLRVVPEQDRESLEVPPPYASALQQVRALGRAEQQR